MAIPSINNLVTYVNTKLTGLQWNSNWQQIVNWFTDGNSDITVNNVTGNVEPEIFTWYISPSIEAPAAEYTIKSPTEKYVDDIISWKVINCKVLLVTIFVIGWDKSTEFMDNISPSL